MTSKAQSFKVFLMTGTVESVDLPVTAGGLNIHEAISAHLNEQLQKTSPYDPNDLSIVRKFKVVYGYEQLDALHGELFAPGSQDRPDYDDLFDNYYARAFLSADRENRNLMGKEFSEAAFEQAPPSMSVHVTVALN